MCIVASVPIPFLSIKDINSDSEIYDLPVVFFFSTYMLSISNDFYSNN